MKPLITLSRRNGRRARRAHQAAPRGRSHRRGFTLIDVVVSVVVASVGTLGLAGMTAVAARRAASLSVSTAQSAEMIQVTNWLATVPYESLGDQSGCVTFSSSSLPHTRCISVTDVGGGQGSRTVKVIITPANSSLRPDTLQITRARGAPANPLKK